MYNLLSKDEFGNLIKNDPKWIISYMMGIAEASRLYPDQALLVPYDIIPIESPTNVYLKDFGWLFATENGTCRNNPAPTWDKIVELIPPYLKDFSFNGYILAGGSIMSIIKGRGGRISTYDYDFYPVYDRNKEGSIQDKAMEIMIKFLKESEEIIKKIEGYGGYEIDYRRNESCTTIWHSGLPEIQFIHRAYPSASSVVTGFDLMACKTFYDGKMVYFTVDAALCLYFGINPVDWRRESPSHLRRIKKYEDKGFIPIFPGLSLDLFVNSNGYKKSAGYCISGGWLKTRDRRQESYVSIMFSDPYSVDIINEEGRSIYERYSNKSSDYEPDASWTNIDEELVYKYTSVVGIIRGDLRKIYLFAKNYLDILNNPETVDIEYILKKVLGGSYSNFYFGNDEIENLNLELHRLLFRRHGGEVPKMKMLTKEEKIKEKNIRRQIKAIFKARLEELNTKAEELYVSLQQVKFITSNPGSQFTCAFNPIFRQKPEDYWGSHYVPVRAESLMPIKLTLLCIRKLRSKECYYLAKVPIDVIRIIFYHLYNYHYRHLASKPLPEIQNRK